MMTLIKAKKNIRIFFRKRDQKRRAIKTSIRKLLIR